MMLNITKELYRDAVGSGDWRSSNDDPSYVPPVDGWTPGQPPVLTSATPFVDGSNMTISGSNFSMNSQTQLFYDDFTGGTLGTAISSGGTAWQTQPTQTPYVYSSDGLAAGKRSAYLDMQGNYDYITGIIFDETDTIYCEHWIKYELHVTGPNDGSGAPQMKLTRIAAGDSMADISNNPSIMFGLPDVTSNSPQVINAPSNGVNATGQSVVGYISLPHDNQWHKLHMAAKISDLGVANGWRYFKTDASGDAGDAATGSWSAGTEKHYASPNAVVAKTAWAGEAWATKNIIEPLYTVEGYFKKVMLPFFTRAYQVSEVWVAGFWLNKTPERAVVSSSADLNTALKTGIIQPSVSKSNTELVVKCELGNQPASGPLYLHVANADGVFSATPLQIRS